MGVKPDKHVEKVNELLLSDGGGWDAEKLNEMFYQADVEDILKIPVGRAGSEDYVAWNYTKNGVFSVRSAYHLKRQLKAAAAGTASSSLNVSEHQGWLSLWSANVPGKVKVHAWRLAKNALAVGEELRRRKIKEGVKCIVCNREESILHRFWTCAHSVHVWEDIRGRTGLGLQAPPGDCRSPRELQYWLLNLFGRMAEQDLAMYLMALYHMWLARNDARNEPMIESPESIARRVVVLTEEWRSLKTPAAVTRNQAEEHWLPPKPGWHKVNSDGALSKKDNHGGGGVIVRDHHGAHVACACHFFPHVDDPERAELLAARRAVLLAKEVGTSKLVLEMDCAGAVSKLNNREVDRSAQGPVVEDIKLLLGEFEDSSVIHVPLGLECFKLAWGKGYHMVHYWHVVKNAPKWKLRYAAYLVSIKNGGAGVAVAVNGKEEAPGQNAIPYRARGHKATKAGLKREASAVALSDTPHEMMTETKEAMAKRDKKRRHEKEATAATFVELTK
ncbi:hypothetical protein QYE76_022378 [Lolium multiflorum]|uniref:RNase H type-1 domain-containing protein n=1 Tax=Lolium multiflorum TaxID=4521 RepID=A0AAD8R9P5_LOLMU|nr:hypothetical protein QYE76_022378 [Lolium multiflorum]